MKLLILTSATGSGHNMRAKALSLWAEQERSDSWDVQINETLETSHPLYRLGVETYNVIQRNAPWAHHIYFNYLEIASMHRNADKIMGASRFTQFIQETKPDIIVSVHGHTNHGFFELARRALPESPPICGTYCGELYGGYGLSRHWINPKADFFIGAAPEICEAAIKEHSMPHSKTHHLGFLLRPPFYESNLDESARRQFLVDEFHLDPDMFTLILSTGDAGANNHLKFLNALEALSLPIQVVALCGRNKSTLEKIQKWSQMDRAVKAIPLGYRQDMHYLMQSVTAIVARPGTGATSEAILCGCPIIHNGMGGIMPQEWITVQFCRSHGIDRVIYTPKQLASVAQKWLEHPDIPKNIRRKMANIKPTQTPKDIIRFLESL
ncbi:MAG: UDP-N-acetylglucosamine--LPS N-acetylglucosamine transferase [Verrucomicrobiota bacterium]